MEKRMMSDEFVAYEVVRQFGSALSSFRAVGGDFGWLLRSVRDIAIKAVRALSKYYPRPEGEAVRTGYVIMRFLMEEALRREMPGPEDPANGTLTQAYLNLVRTMREMEARILNDREREVFLWTTFTDENLALLLRSCEQNASSVRVNPSYNEAMNLEPVKHELLSLRNLESEAELRACQSLGFPEAMALNYVAEAAEGARAEGWRTGVSIFGRARPIPEVNPEAGDQRDA